MVALRTLAGIAAIGVVAAVGCRAPSAAAAAVEVAAGIDHSEWDRLVRTYVDERGLVAYGTWTAAAADRQALARYLEFLAAEPRPAAAGPERTATLINAYNALTVSWILENHPTRGIRSTDDPFGRRRHRVGGRAVSLDDIEHQTLRKLTGYRIHAALVCAARSCPPLAREAYRGGTLDAQLDRAMSRWLAREDLNAFSEDEVRLSMIFRWFREDFEAAGGVREVLRRHAPESARRALAAEDVDIDHLEYDWSLNEPPPR